MTKDKMIRRISGGIWYTGYLRQKWEEDIILKIMKNNSKKKIQEVYEIYKRRPGGVSQNVTSILCLQLLGCYKEEYEKHVRKEVLYAK